MVASDTLVGIALSVVLVGIMGAVFVWEYNNGDPSKDPMSACLNSGGTVQYNGYSVTHGYKGSPTYHYHYTCTHNGRITDQWEGNKP